MQDTIKFINQRTNNFSPEIGIVLGSGLGELADEFCDVSVNYSDIPNFPVSTIKGHKGRLVFAEINGKRVVMMQGRIHYYEGHSMQFITSPVKILRELGVKTLILTNAAGAANPQFNPADLMLIKDHINFMGANPLVGENDEYFGTRFPDMSEIYKDELRQIAKKCAKDLGIDIKEGIYLATSGPSYETPAEVRMFRAWGADVVGMSTIPEAIVANYCGLKVLGISCVTNLAAGVGQNKLTHQEVIESANIAKDKFKSLIREIIKYI